MEKIKDIKSPFMCYCAKVIPLAFDESMSYYECLCNFYNYLKNEVMPVINNNADATKELQDLFIELENYVNHYFDNLDVQEEINNKLDDMYEEGKLTSLITSYLELQITYTFDTLNDMKEATNFVNGCYAKTLGYNELNDGGASYYKIRTKTLDDETDEIFLIELDDDNLVAELIILKELNVKQAGLTGSSEDDATSILTVLCNSDYNLYFPEGTYSINTPITLTHNMRGDGKDKTIIKYDGENHNEMFNAYNLINLIIKDICFDCGEITDILKTSINLYSTEGLIITNCEFKNGYGSHIRLNGSNNVLIENSYFHDITGDVGNMGNAIYCHPVTNLTIRKCSCNNLMEDFLYLDGGSGYTVNNVIVENCDIHNTGHENQQTSANAIGINGDCQNVFIRNNIIYNNINGIKAAERDTALPENIYIENNHIYGNSQNGSSISGTNIHVSNNSFNDNGQDGLYFINTTNLNCSNNIIHDNTRTGLYLNKSYHCNVNNCTIYDNNSAGLIPLILL